MARDGVSNGTSPVKDAVEPTKLVNLEEGGLGDVDKDNYIDYNAPYVRNPLPEPDSEVRVLVVGAGIHGLLTAHHLMKDGGLTNEEVILIDRAGGWGGSWYWNRYPGVMCDVEGYGYLPLLEETGHIPKRRYSYGYEIREQCERIADMLNLKAGFGVNVTHQQWDDSVKRWVVTMTRTLPDGSSSDPYTVKTQFLVCSGGLFPTPLVPLFKNMKAFRSSPGKAVMHTARWDWSVSGGSQEQPDMTRFKDKRVGIVGTGNTAVQVIPLVAEWAKKLYVFQRHSAYVGPHFQQDTTPEFWKDVAYKKGWQYERMVNLDAFFTNPKEYPDRVKDGWSQIGGVRALIGGSFDPVLPGGEEAHVERLIALDKEWSEKMRQRVSQEVDDPDVAEKLKCWAPSWCKRPTFHNSYLTTFNKPNVELIDTNGQGVRDCTAGGVIANGREYELDVLILATGYTIAIFDSDPSKSTTTTIVGRDERTLSDKWKSDDFGTMFGLATNGFPNLFFCTPAGSGVSSNFLSYLENNARTSAHVIRQALERAENPNFVEIEALKDAEDRFTDQVMEKARHFSGLGICGLELNTVTNGTGFTVPKMPDAELRKEPWGEGILGMRKLIAEWTQQGRLEGFQVVG
ncbi:hypothetical protein CkaCkLH20_08128 [Colletotrichum karsti]|uniref:L-ornithine N(5)-oxygenase n=1 Tax=Colletotrichum karsti TaxID=1095194 RepID=A0A9P6I2F6_9PEZI|nr:uncharacterized protein CkaCkLH20_08128 [Colletotrichum karsti]KAF9874565.1 hypothetical protein CkaCkLH20_08128 [Colletotrichum karsti]